MPRTAIIIRHAAPEARPDQGPATWPLSPAGREAAAELKSVIPQGAMLASSDEVKAIETVSLAAAVDRAELRVDDHFGEVRRPGEPFDNDHRSRRRAWVEGRPDGRHTSWETPEQAGLRFQRGLDELDDGTVVVGTHGMVLTAWLVAAGHLEAGPAAGAFWEDLAFPDVVSVRS